MRKLALPIVLLVIAAVAPGQEDASEEGAWRESEDAIQARFAVAKQEISTARQSGAYDAFIVNDELGTAVQQACDLVQRRMAAKHDDCREGTCNHG
jgi:guanylate kinase